MADTMSFALILAILAGLGVVAVLSHRLTEKIALPAPVFFLVGAAILAQVIPRVRLEAQTVERIVTVALLAILFDGGLHLGWGRLRPVLGVVSVVGVVGTFLTVGTLAVVIELFLKLPWFEVVVLATALAPTDPAVVFSVLGRRELQGRAGTILEGESGANDPVGIALMASLLGAGSISLSSIGSVGESFIVEMVVGAVIGVVGGRVLLLFMRRVALPSEGLYPLRTLAVMLLLYGVTTLLHGSGFLAVFVAGIVLGDERAPYKAEIERFHRALASLGEIVAFVVLGLTVHLSILGRLNVWLPGLLLGLALGYLLRPLVVGACLLPVRLPAAQRNFVLLAGLKGAVPILLGTYLLVDRVAHSDRLYGIIVVVVLVSVVVQGSLVSPLARWLRLPIRTVDLEPWALGVRLSDEPEDVHRFLVEEGSKAEGVSVARLDLLPSDAWISLIVREGQVVPARGSTELQAGDEVLVLAESSDHQVLEDYFKRRP
jgi:cell volume regulation protein A